VIVSRVFFVRLCVWFGVALAVGCGSRYRAPVQPELATSFELGPSDTPVFAGDSLSLVVPYAWDGTCAPPVPTVDRALSEAGVPELRVASAAGCVLAERSTSRTYVRVGELAAGRHVVRADGVERSFEVLAADADRGALPIEWQVRAAIARAHPPGTCFGMPSPDAPQSPSLRDDAPTLYHQLLAAFPDEAPDALYAAARSIDVVQRSADRWEYGYTDGSCCLIREVGGEVVLRDGQWQVSEPHAYEQRHVPC
jgi:hypothetical protein